MFSTNRLSLLTIFSLTLSLQDKNLPNEDAIRIVKKCTSKDIELLTLKRRNPDFSDDQSIEEIWETAKKLQEKVSA